MRQRQSRTLTEDVPAATAPEPERGSKEQEPTSAFLPPSFFGGQAPEEGKSYTITVKSVDPDTGQAECEMAEGNEAEPEPAATREQAMDERFPPEQEPES